MANPRKIKQPANPKPGPKGPGINPGVNRDRNMQYSANPKPRATGIGRGNSRGN